MGMKYPRKYLKVDRLYHEIPTDLYFYTPDGIGCVWFKTREEAIEETGNGFGEGIIAINQELEE
jgi:hypothetical protein